MNQPNFPIATTLGIASVIASGSVAVIGVISTSAGNPSPVYAVASAAFAVLGVTTLFWSISKRIDSICDDVDAMTSNIQDMHRDAEINAVIRENDNSNRSRDLEERFREIDHKIDSCVSDIATMSRHPEGRNGIIRRPAAGAD